MVKDRFKKEKKANKTNIIKTEKLDFWQIIDTFSRKWWVIAIMLAIMTAIFFSNYNAVYDRKIDLGGDNLHYYSLGQALSHGEGYTDIMFLNKKPHSHFPPGYPWFISKVIKVFPEDIQTVKKANGVLLYLDMLLLFALIMLVTHNSVLAFCTCSLMVMHKELLRFSSIMMSEPLFIFVSLLIMLIAFLLADGRIGSKHRWAKWVTLVIYGVLVGYAYLVRSIGLSLILSMVAWTGVLSLVGFVAWRRKQKKGDMEGALKSKNSFAIYGLLCLMTIAGVATAKLSWDARNRSVNIVKNDYKSDFLKKTNGETMQTVDDWKERIKSNAPNFMARWIAETTTMKPQVVNPQKNEKKDITAVEWFWAIVLLLAMLLGCAYAGKTGLLLLFYTTLTVMVLILYPEQYGGIRYLVPVTPFFILLMLNGVAVVVMGVCRLFRHKKSPLVFQTVALLLFTFVYLSPRYVDAQTIYRNASEMRSWFNIPDQNARGFLEAARYCGDSLPAEARIIDRKPEIFYMFSKYHHSNGFPQYADPDTIYNMLCRDSIEYLVVDNWYRHAYVTLMPCVRKYPDKFELVKKIGEVDTVKHLNPTLILKFDDFYGYHGQLKDGKREGYGVYNQRNGNVYKGEFANDKPNGQGTLYNSNGQIIVSGFWQDGIFGKQNQLTPAQ